MAIDIVIVGATGVELAAALREASSAYAAYGFGQREGGRDMHITLPDARKRRATIGCVPLRLRAESG